MNDKTNRKVVNNDVVGMEQFINGIETELVTSNGYLLIYIINMND